MSSETLTAVLETKATSLDPLPPELLASIVQNLPRPALMAFAGSCREYRGAFGSRIRETMHLPIPPHCGELPYALTGDYGPLGNHLSLLAYEEAEAALERRTAMFDAGIRERIEQLEEEARQPEQAAQQMEDGGQGEVKQKERGVVRELRLCALPSSRSAILTLVRLLAPHLTRMQVTMGGIIENQDEAKAFALMLECVSSLPNLRQLALTSSESAKTTSGLARAIKKNRSIEDLCWNITADRFWGLIGGEECKHINPLMFMGESEIDAVSFRCLPLMPQLEEVCFAQSTDLPAPLTGLLPMSNPPEAFSMATHFAYNLQRCPKLRTVRYLDLTLGQNGLDLLHQLDSGNAPILVTGRIASMAHDREEVLHAQFRQNFIETADCKLRLKKGAKPSPDVKSAQYSRFTGPSTQKHRAKIFQLRSDFGHVHHTNYRESGVPLEIIRRMQEVEGGDKDWEKRGVEVGRAAWDVLKEWYASL